MSTTIYYFSNMSDSPNYIRTSISLPPAIEKWFKKQAKKYGLTVSGYIVQLGVEDMKGKETGRDA